MKNYKSSPAFYFEIWVIRVVQFGRQLRIVSKKTINIWFHGNSVSDCYLVNEYLQDYISLEEWRTKLLAPHKLINTTISQFDEININIYLIVLQLNTFTVTNEHYFNTFNTKYITIVLPTPSSTAPLLQNGTTILQFNPK